MQVPEAAWRHAGVVLEQELATITPERLVAVFDGDGTLWAGDVGHEHLKVLSERGVLATSHPQTSNVLGEYERRCEQDAGEAYGFACTEMAGLSEALVVATSKQVWSAHRKWLFAPTLSYLRGLQQIGVKPWIVSASNRWVVEQAGLSLGIQSEHVIAMATKVRDGILTEELIEPRPNGTGKVDAIRTRIGRRPVIAFGNSVHDFEMLLSAEHAVFVVDETEPGNYTEHAFAEASQRGIQLADWTLLKVHSDSTANLI